MAICGRNMLWNDKETLMSCSAMELCIIFLDKWMQQDALTQNWTFSFKSNEQEKIIDLGWDWYITRRKGILIDLPSEISVETSCNGHCKLVAVLMGRKGEKSYLV
jgi:hypothetical protein